MKKIDNKGAISLTMIILAIIVLGAIVLIATQLGGDEGAIPTASIVPGVVSADITLTIANSVGTAIASDTTITVYLTSPGIYLDKYDGWAAIDEEGGLVSPYDASKQAGAKTTTPGAAGAATFSIVASKYVAGNPVLTGTDFGVFIKDAGTSITDYNSVVGKIKVNGRDNLDETTIMTVVEGLDGYLGSDIELSQKGDLSAYDPQSGSYNQSYYTLDTAANASLTDKDFDLEVRLNNDNGIAEDVGIYVEELDSVLGTALLTLDDIEVWVNGKKLSGVSLTKVADLDSGSAEKKNAPSAHTSGTSTMWYVEGGEFTIGRTNSNNLDSVIIKLVDFDYDLSSTTIAVDQCDIKIHMVKSNGHKDSDSTAEVFTIKITEVGTTGYTSE